MENKWSKENRGHEREVFFASYANKLRAAYNQGYGKSFVIVTYSFYENVKKPISKSIAEPTISVKEVKDFPSSAVSLRLTSRCLLCNNPLTESYAIIKPPSESYVILSQSKRECSNNHKFKLVTLSKQVDIRSKEEHLLFANLIDQLLGYWEIEMKEGTKFNGKKLPFDEFDVVFDFKTQSITIYSKGWEKNL